MEEQIKPPSLIDKATSLGEAIIDWAKDDFQKVPKDVFEKRLSICRGCPNWDQTGFCGVGKCLICGCSVAKLYLRTSKCPLPEPKWVNDGFSSDK